MSLYELAKQVQPDQLADHESKVVWKSSNGTFVYLIRLENEIYLRMSYSIVQLLFYYWNSQQWTTVTQEGYKEIAELWQSER